MVKKEDEDWKKYDKKTQHEHILARPDMYIGTIQRLEEELWVYDDETKMMVRRKLSYVPGLYKIFDEIIVNAADNKVRDFQGQTMIKVDINQAEGKIRVWNNGEGIPVQMHKQHNLWVPEMIFGHLLTSSNYDDTEAKVTGGRNGFGAKLTNVFSRRFELETVHRGQKFQMKWDKNMLNKSEPVITKTDAEDYTQVTFWPDFPKFGMTSFEDDILSLMTRRAYDLAGTTHKTQKVKLNGTLLPITTFAEYVELYPTLGEEKKNSSYARVNERWEVCVRMSNIGFQQVSFVNAIATMRGGNHVKYITDQVIDKVIIAVQKKNKGMDPKAHIIKPHLFVFINCLIENPSFDSQTKETLNTTKSRFGSVCELPAPMIDNILKSGIVERTATLMNSKLIKEMEGKARTSDRSRITGIPKLEDANDAGTKNSAACTLILTEGDSAKALAVSGLSVVGATSMACSRCVANH
jgi:DNA topoisomerase-2